LAEIADLNRKDLAQTPDIFIAALGEKNLSLAFEWKCAWGLKGIQGDMEFGDKSLKSQMKRAHRLGAKHAMIEGDNEVKEGAVILRDMTTKVQIPIPIEDVVEKIIEKFS
jgi:histidyl-tRNA synthetase